MGIIKELSSVHRYMIQFIIIVICQIPAFKQNFPIKFFIKYFHITTCQQ